MNKPQAAAAVTEAILAQVQSAVGRLVEGSLAAGAPEEAGEAANRFHAELMVIHAASVCAGKALDAVFDAAKPSVATESDDSYRKRLYGVVDAASIHHARIAYLAGAGLDAVGALYDLKRR